MGEGAPQIILFLPLTLPSVDLSHKGRGKQTSNPAYVVLVLKCAPYILGGPTMHRPFLLCLMLLASTAFAIDLSSITNTDATTALRAALTQGADKAVTTLAKQDGFFGNPEVKIPLPQNLQKAEKTLRRYGMGFLADDAILTMNRAAEAAMPEAKALLVDAVKNMTLADAKGILTGGPDSATQYFRSKTETQLATKFKPVIAQATAKTGAVKSYNQFAGKAAQFGLLDAKSANVDDYVTAQALDGLYKMIAKEELAIRADPVAQTSKILQKVFGAITTK